MENKQEIQNRVIDAIMGHSSENVEDYGETYEYNIDFTYNDPEIITLHSKGMFSESFKEHEKLADGSRTPNKFPACISPDSYKNYECHYWFNRHGDDVCYYADILITDVECDAFVVRVHHIYNETCETHLHNCVGTMFDSNILLGLAHAVQEAEDVLSRLSIMHDKALGIVQEDA